MSPSPLAAATRVIVFAKAPVAGLAKTRLAPALGAEGAAALAARLLTHAVRAAQAAGVGPVEVCATPDASHPAFLALAASVQRSTQGDGDLGDRMARAFARALAGASARASARASAHAPSHGADEPATDVGCLLIGTDAPGLDAAYLQQAAAALHHHDAVFGPAFDGGYTLVGLRRPGPALFSGMRWSTAGVMAETRARLQHLGLRHAELPALHDIDEPADLVHLPAGWWP